MAVAIDTIYGTDLAYNDTDGFIAGANGDYAEVNGIENLRRSIYRRLITTPGAWKTRPTYGCGLKQMVKKPLTTHNLLQIKNTVVAQLSQDVRLSAVEVTVQSGNFTGQNGEPLPGVTVNIKALASGQPINLPPFTVTQ